MDFSSKIVDNGKVIIDLNNKRALIATGINYSLSNIKNIEICGKSFNLEDNYMGFSIEDVSNQLKTEIDFVIGSDILAKFNYSINMFKKEFLLSTKQLPLENSIPLHSELDLPYFQVQLNEKQLSVHFDSLSNFSYVNEKNLLKEDEIGEKIDFMVGMGSFTTKIYSNHFSIGKDDIVLETGYYPSVIARSKFLSLEKGVIGSELLKKFSITVNYETNLLGLDKI